MFYTTFSITHPGGNRTRASGETVRVLAVIFKKPKIRFLFAPDPIFPHVFLKQKAACLFGQAAVSVLITAIHLVIP